MGSSVFFDFIITKNRRRSNISDDFYDRLYEIGRKPQQHVSSLLAYVFGTMKTEGTDGFFFACLFLQNEERGRRPFLLCLLIFLQNEERAQTVSSLLAYVFCKMKTEGTDRFFFACLFFCKMKREGADRFFFAYFLLFAKKKVSYFTRSSAIWMALVAAPLRTWSPQHQRERPPSEVRSLRILPT